MTDVVPILGRSTLFRAPFRNSSSQSLFSAKPLKGSDPGLVFLDEVSRLRIVVKGALLVFANPDTDQIAGDIETLRQTVKRLTGKIFLRDLAFELDAVTAIFAMGSLSENPEGGSIPHPDLSILRSALQTTTQLIAVRAISRNTA
jgi:hypothetical protein